ncbi:MAG: 50S ribosomal protein L6 [Candidatus Marinimicrobia bacterium]|nr:50S ribosomal protein L6 [Candidatus Neomarinimicrobiota bacterium]MBL7023064.1 50S ribosomal protein L6 [Candidatus Neomarinimicrobiota bacterium]MBL7109084.1 50S ribosomal protein L6 [Candidatus Neomarinimicrobiota bacterium]
MSRIGKKPINIPEGITVKNTKNVLTVNGKLGELVQEFHKDMKITEKENCLLITRPSDSQKHRELHGLTRALIANMVVGVSEGYTKELHLVGVGYTAKASDCFLILNVGYSHTIYIQQPEGITFETPKPTILIIKGIDKQLVGQIAAKIRSYRKPEPYKGKGIKYFDEHIRRKAGKTVGGA